MAADKIPRKARQYFEQAKALYRDSHTDSTAWKRRFKLLKKAAELGHPEAMFLFADCFCAEIDNLKKAGFKENNLEAKKWAKKAINFGNHAGYVILGDINFYEDKTNKTDYDKAFYYYNLGASLGNGDCYFQLGNCFECGYGVEHNIQKAQECYRKARELGVDGTYYHEAWIEPDPQKAFGLYKEGAKKGEDWCMHELGKAYYFGKYVPRNLTKSKFWFKRAYELGIKDSGEFLSLVESIARGRELKKQGVELKAKPYCHAFITAMSFPTNLEEVNGLMDEFWNGNEGLHLDQLLDRFGGDGFTESWSVPSWTAPGDLAFFYQTKSSLGRARAQLKEAKRQQPDNQRLIDFLEHAERRYKKYHGSIVAVGKVRDGFSPYGGAFHFKSRIYLPIDDLWVFPEPIFIDQFKDEISIKRQATITPLTAKNVTWLKKVLNKKGAKPPDYFANAKIGQMSSYADYTKNWRNYVAMGKVRFVQEAHLREHFIDLLLNEIKDAGSDLLEECNCWQGDRKTGRVDYFVQLGHKWIPVEAKLTITSLPVDALKSQVSQYLAVTKFKRGNKVVETPSTNACLVVDQRGIFIANSDGYIACDELTPLIAVEDLPNLKGKDIREKLLKALP